MTDIALSPVRAEVDSLDWVEKLIRIDTTACSGNLALVSVVKEYLSMRRVRVTTVARPMTGSGTLFASVPDASGDILGGIVFAANCDVASVAGQTWDSNPFRPVIRNGRLYGRGACSMKGFVGLLLGLVPVMASATLSCPIHIALCYSPRTTNGRASAIDNAVSEFIDDVRPVASISGRPTNMQVVVGHKWRQTGPNTRPFHVSTGGQLGIDAASKAAALRAFARLETQLVAVPAPTSALDEITSPPRARSMDLSTVVRQAGAGVCSVSNDIGSVAIKGPCHQGANAFDALSKTLALSGNNTGGTRLDSSDASSEEHLSLSWGPGQPRLIAAENEYVELAQLARCSAGLKGLIAELAMDSI
ncbi:hypothetical protein A6V36_30400 [Paraburkholderia ginsengiterrae]|uniref:Acetylornithine deacetylase n=1 Tax=Paraburkholderia ginsengiterrae TaxID=1462993 RepID=A0A1A9N272_9BURK|nr:M20/M25/M40 family metallo-hydrolase [Paraburkholderia ginsengiterrae]OAJ55983.1 hypothetical protein A6V37_32220 [Paraburkholderia ginsengiterrae]OAJ58559.1 hypothetical protein A6V36_30400 [Paraburkholderia ginsengiterrae]